MIVKFVEKKKELWDQYLETCLFAYNSSRHESTHFSPFELVFGRKAVLPIDLDTEKSQPEAILQKHNSEDDMSSSHAAAKHQEVQSLTLLEHSKSKRSSMIENAVNQVYIVLPTSNLLL